MTCVSPLAIRTNSSRFSTGSCHLAGIASRPRLAPRIAHPSLPSRAIARLSGRIATYESRNQGRQKPCREEAGRMTVRNGGALNPDREGTACWIDQSHRCGAHDTTAAFTVIDPIRTRAVSTHLERGHTGHAWCAKLRLRRCPGPAITPRAVRRLRRRYEQVANAAASASGEPPPWRSVQ